jgi:hypothetical protein
MHDVKKYLTFITSGSEELDHAPKEGVWQAAHLGVVQDFVIELDPVAGCHQSEGLRKKNFIC